MNLLDRLRHIWLLHKVDILIVVVLFVLAGVPRLFDLGIFLTADEKNWIGRAYEFVRAFKDFRFNDMLQTTHPGVTTLWAVGVSIVATIATKHIPFSFGNLPYFVTPSQVPVALLTTLSVIGIYFFLRKLLPGRWLPFLGAAVVALDPFLIGYSRVAHVDALMGSFLTLAVLAVIFYGHDLYNRRYLVISGVLAALALLTKIPAVFIIPFFLLTVLISRPHLLKHKYFLLGRARDFIQWLLLIGLLFVIIWPALIWVPNPQGNILVLKRDFVAAAETPHDMTEDYTLNGWQYPATLITRTNPVSLFFGLFCVIALVVEGVRRLKHRHFGLNLFRAIDRQVLWLLVAYIFFFVLMMTLGAKKGDRYILPVFFAIDILAAVGIYGLAQILIDMWPARKQLITGSVFGLAGIYLLAVVWHYHPYEISYSNPLFPDNLSQELGWGEGLDQVAAWFNANAPQAIVASWYPDELGAFTSAHVVHINAHQQNNVQYVVLYRNMFGRAADHPANDFIDEYYKKKNPVFVAHIVGKEFAWVYEKRSYERIVGELLPGIHVGQMVTADFNALAGVEFLPATYSGLAKSGTVTMTVTDTTTGQLVGRKDIPVSSLEDNGWSRMLFAAPVDVKGHQLLVDLTATGTSSQAAPTVRYTVLHDYRAGDFDSASGSLSFSHQKKGDLAIRLLYQGPQGLTSEEDAKLLQTLEK